MQGVVCMGSKLEDLQTWVDILSQIIQEFFLEILTILTLKNSYFSKYFSFYTPKESTHIYPCSASEQGVAAYSLSKCYMCSTDTNIAERCR